MSGDHCWQCGLSVVGGQPETTVAVTKKESHQPVSLFGTVFQPNEVTPVVLTQNTDRSAYSSAFYIPNQ